MNKDVKEKVGKADIPEVPELKTAILSELASGRQRAYKTVCKDVVAEMGLSAAQKRYKIKGSKTTMLENRLEEARAELKKEGFVEYPATGKLRITEKGKVVLQERKTVETSVSDSSSKTESLGLDASFDDAKIKAEEALAGVNGALNSDAPEKESLSANESFEKTPTEDVVKGVERPRRKKKARIAQNVSGSKVAEKSQPPQSIEPTSEGEMKSIQPSGKSKSGLKGWLPLLLVVVGLLVAVSGTPAVGVICSAIGAGLGVKATKSMDSSVRLRRTSAIGGA